MFGRSLNKYTSNERKPVQIFPWVDKKVPSLHLAHKWNSFFSETSVLMCSETSVSHMVFGKRGPFFGHYKQYFWRKQKGFTFLSQSNFSCLSHLQRNLSTEEKKMRRQLIVAFEKQTLKWQRKEDKIICGKANSYFRRLSGRFRKNEEISKVVYFFSFGLKLKMKLVETVSVTIGVKFRQTSYASKTN